MPRPKVSELCLAIRPDGSMCGKDARSKGLCKYHYERERLGHQVRRVTDADGDVPTAGEGGDALGEADPGLPVLGDGETPRATVSDEGSSPYMTSGERPPGAVGTPSPPRAAAGPEVTPSAPTSKIKSFFSRKGKDEPSTPGGTPPVTREKRPSGGRVGRRASAADTIADGWAALGGVAVRTGTHAPLGRCMQWQAPVAGEMLDEALANTFLDKVALQRVVKGRQKFDLLGAVLGPPLLVMAIERNPAAGDTLFPLLASSIRSSLPLMVPAIKKVQEKEKKVAEATALLFEDDPNYTPGTDPVEHIIRMMFADWAPPAQVVPEPVPEAEDAVA